MTILFNALHAGNRSGTGRYATELARRLPGAAPDLDVRVLWPAGTPRPCDLADSATIAVPVQSPLARIWHDQVGIRTLARNVRARLLHYPANVGPLVAPCPYVVTLHDLTFFRNPEWYGAVRAEYYQYAVARTARGAEAVIVDSSAVKADVVDFLRVPEERVHVIPLGVDSSFTPASKEHQAEVRARYGLPERFYLYAGTIEPRKNLLRLIQAWALLDKPFRHDLVIAGRLGWKTQAVREAAAAYDSHVHCIGFVPQKDLPSLLSAADVFVWPSLWEGFGLPPLEAMACGTPVITSATSSLPETVGDAALLVNPLDTDAIGEAMRRLAGDQGLRADLAAKGRARAALMTWDSAAHATVDRYRQIGHAER